MRIALLLVALVAPCVDDETWSATITVDAMHCDECKASLEANLKQLKGVTTVEVNGTTAKVAVLEKQGIAHRSFVNALPTDLKLKSIDVKVRGVIGEKGDRLELRAKSSAQVFRLANKDDKTDVIGPLKKDLAPPAKFAVAGELDKADTLLLSAAPAKTDWKD